ncbi:MAG: NAD(P)/FAD-dependent oxidoreductase [Nocardioidaceae bacterium]
MTESVIHDVVVIGAGVVGSAISRHLAGFALDVVTVEARRDVGDGTSKANTAILHTGFDASPGTLESRLVHQGYLMLRAYCAQTGIPMETTSALLVAWDDEQLASLPTLQDKARKNGYDETHIVDADHVYATVPDLGPGALGGLVVPGESIICTWTTSLALATDAVNRGLDLRLETAVTGIDVGAASTVVHTTQGDIETRWVVNAAGLGGDTIERMLGFERFTLNPRRGELLVFDKLAGPKVPVIVLPVPSKVGKGVLVSPTIYGNVMVGPTAEDMEDRADTATTEEGFAFLREKGGQLMPSLMTEEVTAAYAGLRAAHDQSDYVIEADAEKRYVVAGCIRSTGLTSSMAVAEHVADLLAHAGLSLVARDDLPEAPSMPPIGEHQLRPYADDERIEGDPAYGSVVCFCERVTEGEIRDALAATIPARDLGGLRRRTRAHNGRCQGFFCGARLTALLEEASS